MELLLDLSSLSLSLSLSLPLSLSMCVCGVCVCVCAGIHADRKDVGFPESGIKGGYELSCLVVGSPTGMLYKHSKWVKPLNYFFQSTKSQLLG